MESSDTLLCISLIRLCNQTPNYCMKGLFERGGGGGEEIKLAITVKQTVCDRDRVVIISVSETDALEDC